MPKNMMRFLFIIAVLSLGLAACGGGDKGGVTRTSPMDIVSGSSGTGGETGGTSGTGGGGGISGNGSCVITASYGGQTVNACYENVSQSFCQQASGQYSSGASCASLGYPTCQTSGGYTICY